MTNRENFLSLLRRQGYEHVPVEFVLCPHLQELCKEKLGAEDYEEYFGFPWRRVDDLKLADQDVEKFRKFYERPLAEGADIDLLSLIHICLNRNFLTWQNLVNLLVAASLVGIVAVGHTY